MKTVDGFPVQDNFNFLVKADPELNPWSVGKKIKIDVADYYLNPRRVTHKGKTILVGDYELFTMLIKSWMKGVKVGFRGYKNGMTKDQALDEFFAMEV